MGWASFHIEKLKLGQTVKFRPHGNSMVPRVQSGDLCTVSPIGDIPVKEDDIVLCTVGGRQLLHLVTAVKGERYQISNNHGHVNGYVGYSQIHGRLVAIDP